MRVTPGVNFIAFFDSESEVIDFRFQADLNEFTLGEKLAQSRLNTVFAEPDLKTIQHLWRDIPALCDLVIAHVFGSVFGKRTGSFHSGAEGGHLRGQCGDVGHNAAATGHRAPAIGLEIGPLIGMLRGGAEVEFIAREGFLDRTSAGYVVERRSERETGFFGQRINTLHQTLTKAGFPDDRGAVMILQ